MAYISDNEKKLLLNFVKLIEFEHEQMRVDDRLKKYLVKIIDEKNDDIDSASAMVIASEIISRTKLDYRKLLKDFIVCRTSKMV